MIGEHRGGKGIEGNVGKEKVREGKDESEWYFNSRTKYQSGK